MRNSILISIFSLTIILIACKKEVGEYYSSSYSEVLPAGNCTVFDQSSLAFSYKINGMTTDQNLDFFVGNSFFNQNWVESPSSTTARDGLGPLFNARSCSSCHFRDGRGAPFSGEGLLLRLSVAGGNPEVTYGGQFQDGAISNVSPEGNISITYTEIPGTFNDGVQYSLRHPNYNMVNLNYGAIDPGVMVSPRVGNQMIGLGLLEIIEESDILSHADEADADGDGISGKANYVMDAYSGSISLGRFGWKANTPSINTQVAAAFNGDLGIKTNLFSSENHTSNQSNLDLLANGGIVEINDEDLDKVVLYCRTLGVPARRNSNEYNIQKGSNIFNSLNCNKCHVESYVTGTAGDIEPLKNVRIYPYTDLLVHDMGPELADNRPDGLANGNEWRTPPLWGIGLFKTVNNHTFLLHDGRARSVEEAILWHGGEGEASKNAYKNLPAIERSYLLEFLNSL
ncbi:MAG: thiol oxidoreductase [Crocinitomicaceae bacterium]|nr:thiol oxidoreductase [Crocinitomicaceae bacterium]